MSLCKYIHVQIHAFKFGTVGCIMQKVLQEKGKGIKYESIFAYLIKLYSPLDFEMILFKKCISK